jgi:hypothetical protein
MSKNAIDLIRDIFDPHQLLLIETAFESYRFRYLCDGREDFVYSNYSYRIGVGIDPDEKLTYDECIVCNVFHKKHISPKNRLIAIMKNIIKNDGVFLPLKIVNMEIRIEIFGKGFRVKSFFDTVRGDGIDVYLDDHYIGEILGSYIPVPEEYEDYTVYDYYMDKFVREIKDFLVKNHL